MTGERVIVRDHKGKPLIRRVWAVSGEVVYITDDEQFQRLDQGLEALQPIGFPIRDVFRYTPEAVKALKGRLDWRKLTPWLQAKAV